MVVGGQKGREKERGREKGAHSQIAFSRTPVAAQRSMLRCWNADLHTHLQLVCFPLSSPATE